MRHLVWLAIDASLVATLCIILRRADAPGAVVALACATLAMVLVRIWMCECKITIHDEALDRSEEDDR
jgi:hypothetical protein